MIVPCGHPFGWEAPVISTLAGASFSLRPLAGICGVDFTPRCAIGATVMGFSLPITGPPNGPEEAPKSPRLWGFFISNS